MDERNDANWRRWNEVVGIHLASDDYAVAAFRQGRSSLHGIEDAEIGDVAGKRLLHLQCHFGLDTLKLARRGALVTGLDYSPNAIAAARRLAAETNLEARFVEGNLYDAPGLIDGRFDIVYVSWGAICWLPDIRRWAKIAADFLEPGGFLYLLEPHPVAFAMMRRDDGLFEVRDDYFARAPIGVNEERTYTGNSGALVNTRFYNWLHPLGDIVMAVHDAGLALEYLREHDGVAWAMYPTLVEGADRIWRLPAGQPQLPLSFSLKARCPRA
ncbi:MAG TPA: class I SAM-dependent methyltransferase [Candidatus Cybelea sp.]|nr:class I SAM-dependent methyltransferase [Candidatus Cybelea sp.]